MASAVTTQKFFSRNYVTTYDHDPGATTAVITSPDGGTTKRVVSLQDYEYFAVAAMVTIVAAGGLTKLEIVGCTDSVGSNPTVVVDSGTVAADAVGDVVVLECTAEQVKEVGNAAGLTLTHVAARLTQATSTDEAAVTYIRSAPKFATLNLCGNQIS